MKSAEYNPEAKRWSVSDAAFQLAGRTILGLHFDVLQLERELDRTNSEAYLDQAESTIELGKWYRQWYNWLAIVVSVGAVSFGAGYLTGM